MRGKTAAEVTRDAEQLAQIAQKALLAPQQPQNPPPQQNYYQPPQQQGYGQPPVPAPQIDPGDFVTGAHLQGLGQQFQQQVMGQVQPQMQAAVDMAASSNYHIIKDKYAKEFAKYGPEINGRLAHLPRHTWTIDSLEEVVNLVRAHHIDDLVRERTEQHLGALDPAFRSTGAAVPPTPAQAPSFEDALNDAQKSYLRSKGLTPEVVLDHCKKMGMDPKKWYEQKAKMSVGDMV